MRLGIFVLLLPSVSRQVRNSSHRSPTLRGFLELPADLFLMVFHLEPYCCSSSWFANVDQVHRVFRSQLFPAPTLIRFAFASPVFQFVLVYARSLWMLPYLSGS